MRHLIISYIGNSILPSKIQEIINILKSDDSTACKFYISVRICKIHEERLISKIVQDISSLSLVDIIIVEYQGSTQSTHRLISRLSEQNSKVVYGISSVPSVEITQWLLECEPAIRLVTLHQFSPPNFALREIEFLHSKGVNVMVQLQETHITSLDFLVPMASCYGDHSLLFLVKYLMLNGVIVSLQFRDKHMDLLSHALAAGDPLAHRQDYSSSTSEERRIKISSDHMDEIAALSELEEAKRDIEWTELATTRHPVRTLKDEL